MVKHNLLKKISLGIASLALICPLALGGLSNSTVANARRRPRTHRVYRHHRRARKATRRRTRRARKARRVVRRHHESQATWYKNNAVRLYNRNYYTNHSFRRGITYGFLGQHGIGDPVIDRNDLNNNKFKQGWIIGFATTDMHAGYCDHIAPRTIRYSSNNHNFNYAIKQWNNGKNYLNNMDSGNNTSFDAYSEQWGSGNNF